MENQIENLNSPNEEVEQIEPEVNQTQETEPILIEETQDEVSALKAKNQELYEQLKKAKGFVRDDSGQWAKKPQPVAQPVVEEKTGEDISNSEIFTLISAGIPQEDKDEVVLYARTHKISVSDAVKSPEVKAILKVREDYRKSSEVSNTGVSRRGSVKVSGDTLLTSAEKGQVPESDEEIQRLIDARFEAKRTKRS
jgi:hypothetical protein